MSEDTLFDDAAAGDNAPAKGKKKAAKKAAAKKAAVKVAAPKATKAAVKPAEKAPAKEVEKPAKKIAKTKAAKAEAPKAEAPKAEPAPEVTPPLFPPAPEDRPKRATKKAAKKTAPAPVSEPAPAPVAEAPAAAPESTAPAPAPHQGHGQHRGHQQHPQGQQQPQGQGQQGQGAPAPRDPTYTDVEGTGGRKLRWWEKRKLDRRARQAARAAQQGGGGGGGGGGGEQQHSHAPKPHQQYQQPQQQYTEGGAEGYASDSETQRPVELGPPEPTEGLLEIGPKGHGFLRLKEKSWNALVTDCFVHGDVIRKNFLRNGMYIKGEQRKGPRGPQLTEVTEANGRKPEDLRELPIFEELKAINPNKRYQLETKQDRFTTRVIDMLAPVGRGQRGLIVSPPRAGKTTILHHIAEAIAQNYPQVHLMVLLVDERPEEVTEFKRTLTTAEIFASSNDQDGKSHSRIAELAIERAKRLVEQGDQVFMLMDSVTRLARAYNNMNKNTATQSGGLGVGSMEIPRRLFAAARNTRTAGSLTILATALIETGSRMDDAIFQEFKGTGNMELVLDRKIAEMFYWPAVNIFKSGTRREELLLQGFHLEKIHFLRRGLAGHKPVEAIQRVLSLLERSPNNAQMLVELSSKER